METFVNGVEVTEKVKSLQIETWVAKDGKVVKVNESAHLGIQPMKQSTANPKVYECVGAYGRPASKIPVTFTLESLGTVAPKTQVVAGMHEANTIIPALSFLDEPEKLAALSEAEKRQLESIGIVDLKKLFEGWTPTVHTAIQDAAIAIYQHPKASAYISEHNTATTTGDHADGAKATLAVGTHMFTVGDKYFHSVGYSFCEGKDKYSFTWMNVPLSFLDEPK